MAQGESTCPALRTRVCIIRTHVKPDVECVTQYCSGVMGVSWLDRQLGMHMERPHLKQDGGQGLTPGAVL